MSLVALYAVERNCNLLIMKKWKCLTKWNEHVACLSSVSIISLTSLHHNFLKEKLFVSDSACGFILGWCSITLMRILIRKCIRESYGFKFMDICMVFPQLLTTMIFFKFKRFFLLWKLLKILTVQLLVTNLQFFSHIYLNNRLKTI